MPPRADRNALKRSQPSSPASPATDIKKPRHGDMLHGNLDEPTTPTKASGAAQSANAMSPPNRAESQRTPTSSPDGQETQATQVASQVTYPEVEDEEADPNVWGYLEPVFDVKSKIIKLNKSPDCNNKTGTGTKPSSSKKEAKPNGFLVGRHPECDLRIENHFISNRHSLIYKEIFGGTTKAILEDFSSNGTWVNGVLVGRNKRRELGTGDDVEFAGGFKYHFRYPARVSANRFGDTYTLGTALGSGHFATVYTAVEKKSGAEFAVKIFRKKRTEEASHLQAIKSEIAMLMSVSHPNVLALKGTYNEDDGVYLVLELAPEGELFNYIIKHKCLTEDQTRHVFKQLLSGLKYLHDRNIAHRDIKPENILLMDKELTVKLGDFGLAKIIGEDSFTTSLCGTPSYVAPEILESSRNSKYSRTVDIWSMGVVLYICLCGFPPFSDELYTAEKPYTLSQQIRLGCFEFPSPYWDHVDDSALYLITRMIEVDPERRISVDDALHDPWITEETYHPGDSCGSLTHAIENFKFVRTKVKQERTLLAEAPDLLNTGLRNEGNAQESTTHHRNNDKGKNKQEAETNGGDEAAGNKAEELDASTKAFVHVGGKGIDEPLYEDDSSFESAK